MPAIEQAMGAVPLQIIKPASCLAVIAGGCWFTGKQGRRPGAVMRLQTQPVIRVALGQLQQPIRQSASTDDYAGTDA